MTEIIKDKRPVIMITLASMRGGGIQKSAIRLINEFLRLGIPTSLITIDANGPVRSEVPYDCRFIDLGVGRTRWAIFRLIASLKEIKPDVVISAQTHLNVLLIIARALSGYPKKLIVTEHITFNTGITSEGKFSQRMRPYLIRFLYPFAERVVAVSPASADSIYQYTKLKTKVDVILNGLDMDEIKKAANQPVFHPWVSNSDFKLIVGMGRLSLQKNFSYLLRAFARLDSKEKYRLLILGEGSDKTALLLLAKQLEIQEYVEFLGFIDNPYPYLAQADLFVLPSKWEGFANVIIEALACGTPVIAADCPGGPADILSDKSFAKIVPMDNPKEMASAIKGSLSADIDSIGIFEFAKQFSIQDTAQNYLNLIGEIRFEC